MLLMPEAASRFTGDRAAVQRSCLVPLAACFMMVAAIYRYDPGTDWRFILAWDFILVLVAVFLGGFKYLAFLGLVYLVLRSQGWESTFWLFAEANNWLAAPSFFLPIIPWLVYWKTGDFAPLLCACFLICLMLCVLARNATGLEWEVVFFLPATAMALNIIVLQATHRMGLFVF